MAYPHIEWIEEGDFHNVLMNGSAIVEIGKHAEKGYTLSFVPTAGDNRQIGHPTRKDKRPSLGWGVQDYKLVGYRLDTLDFENHPDEGWFLITVRGGKPNFECRSDVTFKGVWHEDEGCFHYFHTRDMECKLEDLYQNSMQCQAAYEKNPDAPVKLEAVNLFFAHTSLLDIHLSDEYPYPRPLYPWFVMSTDGESWKKSPMVHIYNAAYKEEHPYDENEEFDLINYPTRYGKPGAYFGCADDEYGGWLVKTLETTKPVGYSICWMYFDVHTILRGVIPPRYSCEDLKMHYACEYIPIAPQRCAQLIEDAAEYDWRHDIYDVPVFSTNNRFSDSLRTLPGDKVAQLNYWSTSSDSCILDHTVGYDDSDSASIVRTEDKPIPAAWHCRCWGMPYTTDSLLGKRYRMSAMVKAENCTGKIRIGKVSMAWGGDLWHGSNTHYANGEPKPIGGLFAGMDLELDLNWAFSDSITGSCDWTPISVEFDVLDLIVDVFLEMGGTGRCWFDNVTLEEIGTAQRIVQRNDFHPPVNERDAKFAAFWKDYDPLK
ncbi:MAG: hypothetical protein IJ412_10530 [Oscillospiraceae bacterium]|nr:hypothetical protein [Oscillospiraceae bacterium]